MNHKLLLFLILGIDGIILLFKTSDISISYSETLVLYGDTSLLQLIIQTSIYFFGTNDFALRLPMIILHLSSALLLYMISQQYINKDRNKIWLILVFVLLPGVISSGIIVNSAGLVIFELLLFLYIYQKFDIKYTYLLLLIYALLEHNFIYLFFSLIFFALYKKDYKFLILNIALLLISIYLFGTNISGSPSGHFLDTLGLYSAIFTPIVFVYIFYVLYRRLLIKEIDIIWFISSITLILSLILSFRQRILIEDFAPYLIIALPLAAQTFYSSYRIRLPNFRKGYRYIFVVAITFLFINATVVLFNKDIYRFIDDPKSNFAYKMHIAKELALKLKEKNIHCVKTSKKMRERLKFYGIKECEENQLQKLSLDSLETDDVTISYRNKIIYRGSVTKLNIK